MKKFSLIFLFSLFFQLYSFSNVMSIPGDKQWMLDEHTQMTLEILNDWKRIDTFSIDGRTVYDSVEWLNNEAKGIVLSANMYVDLEDKGTFVTRNLFSGFQFTEIVLTHLALMYKKPATMDYVASILNLLRADEYRYEIVKSSAGFNSYIQSLSDNNLSNTKGFHFDNVFTYDDAKLRWKEIDDWVNSRITLYPRDLSKEKYRKLFVMIGMLLHAIQDFYCHSNWVVLTGFYGYKNNKVLSANVLPTWEEISDPVWLSQHNTFETDSVLNKFRKSDTGYSSKEFGDTHPNGGLQTGNCKNYLSDIGTCAIFGCDLFEIKQKDGEPVKPWRHRHPGDIINLSSIEQIEIEKQERKKALERIFFAGAYDSEYSAAIELAKRSTLYWINKILDPKKFSSSNWKEIKQYLSGNKNIVKNWSTGCELNLRELFVAFSRSYKK